MEKQIIEALLQLDPKVDDHWTEDGLPRIDAVAPLLNIPVTELKRRTLTNAAPDLKRETYAQWVEAQQDDPEGDDEQMTGAVPQPAEASDDDRAQLEAAVREHEAEVASISRDLAEGQRQLAKANKRLDAAREALTERFPPPNATSAVKQHLARQLELRMERARSGQLQKTPLDASLSGRKRSETRPQPKPHVPVNPLTGG